MISIEKRVFMDWTIVMENITNYVEQHLQRDDPKMDEKTIAKMAHCSFGFFQKVFSYLNDISFSDYIRYRKLTLAGYDLKATSARVIDISYQYGYDSVTSFTKAFQKFHGVTPSVGRQPACPLKIYPRFSIATKTNFSWFITPKETLRLIGKKWTVSTHNNQHYYQIPQLWQQCIQDGTYDRLLMCDDAKEKGVFGMFTAIDSSSETIEYAIMVCSKQPIKNDWQELIVPENQWAVFNCQGPAVESIQKGWRYLNDEWIAKYPFKHASAPEMEWYAQGNQQDKKYLSQIWIPIIKER